MSAAYISKRFAGRREMVATEVSIRRQGKAHVPRRLSGREPESGPRHEREASRKLLADGIDPSENRKAMRSAKADRAANSFQGLCANGSPSTLPLWAESHSSRVLRRFEREVFPWIGARAISDVTAPELLTVLRRIENRGSLETAHRALRSCAQVLRYAVATGRCKTDPSRDLRGALPPVKGGHFAATTEPAQLGPILRALDGYRGDPIVCCALRIAPLSLCSAGRTAYGRMERYRPGCRGVALQSNKD